MGILHNPDTFCNRIYKQNSLIYLYFSLIFNTLLNRGYIVYL